MNTHRSLFNLLVALALAIGVLFVPGDAISAQPIPPEPIGGVIQALPGININSLPYSYSQTFDNPPTGMPTSGNVTWVDDSTVSNWSAKRSGTGTTIVANDGGSNTGALYSYGTGTNGDRALGSVGSGNAAAGNFYWGVCFKNDLTSSIGVRVGYTGEQWRNSAALAQTVDFAYIVQSSGCAEVNGTGYTDFDALDFISPITGGSAGALDGNASANRVVFSPIVLPPAIQPGYYITLRWYDPDHSGSDHGLSIDDFSLTAVDLPPTVVSHTPADGAIDVAVDTNVIIQFSEPVDVTTDFMTLQCGESGIHSFSIATPDNITYTIDPDTDYQNNELCTVTIFASSVTDQDGTPDPMEYDYGFSFTTVGADVAPTVTGTVPANGATSVAVDAAITVNFSESVTTTGDWFELACPLGTPLSFTVSGTGDSRTITPDDDLPFGTLCSAKVIATLVADEDGIPPANMTADYTWSFTTTACGAPYTAIHAIQGSGAASPLVGQSHTVEGIVTARYSSSTTGLGGHFLQTLPGLEDSDPQTSEGIFIYGPSLAVTVGDHLRLTGNVVEYNSSAGSYGQMYAITELNAVTNLIVCASGQTLPAPTVVDLPDTADQTFDLERYESMLVTIPETLTVQQNYFQGRFGQVTLGAGGRVFHLHNFLKNGGSLFEYTRMLILDDGSHYQNPNPIPYYAADGALRAGDTVTGVTGVLDQGRINSARSDAADFGVFFPYVYYRLHPTAAPVFTPANTRLATPPEVGGRIKMASFNVLNYFTTLDDGTNPPPYNGSNTPRGANTAAEFTRQQAKLVAALAALDADIYGLMEIESWDGANSGNGAVQALVDALNSHLGQVVYMKVDDPATGFFTPEAGGDYIQVAIIYRVATVTPVGVSLSSNESIFSRSPFAQTFMENSTGAKFSVVVNHFKSKGSCPANPADPNADQGDGQGCWNARRIEQAQALLTFINTTLLPIDPDVFVIGDLNAYGAEDPIAELITGGLLNQVAAFVAESSRYSYVFDGAAGYLDHALSTTSLTAQITDIDFWHINADEPSVIDYNTEFKPVDLYLAHVYRASDHDPVVIGLNPNTPPQAGSPIPDQTAYTQALFSFTVAVDAFSDPDIGDTLTYTATLGDGSPLPAWLSFAGGTRTFNGTPAMGDLGTLTIQVTATDGGGEKVSTAFTLQVLTRIFLPAVLTMPTS